MKVIVVGAGTAGLAAVHTLKKNGVDVLCLEAGTTAGGRVQSKRIDGFTYDLGAQFFFRYYDTYFTLCRELGMGDELVRFPFRAALPNRKTNRLTPILASVRPRDLPRVIMDLAGFRGVPLKAVAQLLPLAPTLMTRNRSLRFTDYESSLDMDHESFADFTLRKGGREVLEHVIQPIASCMTLGEPEDIAAGYGLGLFWYMINGLWTLRRGIGSLSERMQEKYGDSIQLNTPVKKIVIEKGKVKGVEVKNGFIKADRVICTTTVTTLRKIAPDLPESITGPLKNVRYSECCHAMFALGKRIFPEGWYAAAIPRNTGSPMAGFADNSIKSRFYAPAGAGMIHCFTFGRHAHELNGMSDDKVTGILFNDMKRFVPSMSRGYLHREIVRYKEAVCLSPPGMLTEVNTLKKQGIGDVRGLQLAGEYLYMPSVNGAAQSGIDAGERVLRLI
ncbi:MAG: hypothetical protein CVV44_10385 [Spirochaetae bacterium HGW-Spirochaetae-1]|jgi:oxygen-dependent protoporphyrinogen oxidase|nr:MAG: hypothetical protein CVV44_10385 [Spirochaetae bacterium HGW-Spirochaetae-1]